MKKKTIIFCIFFIIVKSINCQITFNRIYRFDSLQSNATVFRSLRVIENKIYLAGTSVVNIGNLFANSGIFTRLDMNGHIENHSLYIDTINAKNIDFQDDIILPENNNKFTLAAYNFDGSFSLLQIDKNGNISKKNTFNTNDTSKFYFVPTSIIKSNSNYIISQSLDTLRGTKAIIFFTDSLLNHTKTFQIQDGERVNVSTKIIKNKNNNLTLSLFKTGQSEQDTDYVYISQLREIDTLGNTLWVYNTPRDRFIYVKKFVQLANGNYLVWGDEELSKNVWGGTYWYRGVYDVFPYLAEINPQQGLIWEKRVGVSGRIYGFKLLKDSSMVLACSYYDGPFNSSSCLIKLNKNRDSIYRRNFRATSLTSNRVINYPNQIEELDNGDLLIGGYVWDLPVSSPTTGQWGWLVRTDSMGCSLEPSSCRTPTKDIENTPLSIKAYPNPTSSNIQINWDFGVNTEGGILQIFNSQGQQIFNTPVRPQTNDLNLTLPLISDGLYYLSIKIFGQGVSLQKLIISK